MCNKKRMKNKTLTLFLTFILLVSVLPLNILAQEDNIGEIDVIETSEIEVVGEDEIEDEEEIEELEEITEDEKGAIFRLSRVTTAGGFIMKDDESDAQFFRGRWIVRRFVEKADNLADVDENNIKTNRFGFVVIGVGNEKEKFKIRLKENSEEEVIFNLLNREGENAGELKLTPKKYERITLWFGTLTLNSGNYNGEWSITAVAKTKIIIPKIIRPSRWNIFAFKERREAELKERLQEKILEKEKLGEFAKRIKGKNLRDLDETERRIKRDVSIKRVGVLATNQVD